MTGCRSKSHLLPGTPQYLFGGSVKESENSEFAIAKILQHVSGIVWDVTTRLYVVAIGYINNTCPLEASDENLCQLQ